MTERERNNPLLDEHRRRVRDARRPPFSRTQDLKPAAQHLRPPSIERRWVHTEHPTRSADIAQLCRNGENT
jgi:hypothetical protein